MDNQNAQYLWELVKLGSAELRGAVLVGISGDDGSAASQWQQVAMFLREWANALAPTGLAVRTHEVNTVTDRCFWLSGASFQKYIDVYAKSDNLSVSLNLPSGATIDERLEKLSRVLDPSGQLKLVLPEEYLAVGDEPAAASDTTPTPDVP